MTAPSATASRRERERLARREALLEAGERVLERVGYRKLRMDEVAREGEVSKGTVYLYFPSKDALCAAIAARNISQKLPDIRDALEHTPTGLARVAKLIEGFGKHFANKPHSFRWLLDWFLAPQLEDQSDDFAAYRSRVDEIFGLLIRSLETGQQDGSVRGDVDPTHQALAIWTSGLGVHLIHHNAGAMRQRTGHVFDPDTVLAVHRDNLLRGLRP